MGKVCIKCGETKEPEQFKKESKCPDGRGHRCKTCYNKISRDYQNKPEVRERVQNSGRKQLYKERYKGRYKGRYNSRQYKATHDRWFAQNPLAKEAHKRVEIAVKKGYMPRVNTLACSRCGNEAKHYHHHRGYSVEYQLDVIPLCHSCHRAAHAKT
jgi:hypothetical protein